MGESDSPGPTEQVAAPGDGPASMSRPLGSAVRDVDTAAPVIGSVRQIPACGVLLGDGGRAADVALDGVAVGRRYLAAASSIGIAHLVSGSCRQDAYSFGLDRAGRLCVALADGLGSRSLSHLGARIFCEEAIRVACDGDDSRSVEPAGLIAVAARKTAHIATELYGIDPRATGYVAIVAVFGTQRCELARVGDASAFTLTDTGFAELFDDDSEFLNLVDAALPDDEDQIVTAAAACDASTIVLVTDGVANDIRTSERVRTWLSDQWRIPTTAYAMGDSLRYRRQGSHDDRSAVVVWAGGGEDADE